MPADEEQADAPDDERLEITLEDLDDVDEAPTPQPPAQQGIVIELDDEEQPSPTAAPVRATASAPGAAPLPGAEVGPREYPGLPTDAGAAKEGKKARTRRRVVTSNLIYTALFGLIGGLIAWALTEPTISQFRAVGSLGKQIVHELVFFGVVGLSIGFAIGAVEGATMKLFERAMGGGGIGALLGVIGGAAGGALSQAIYGAMSRQFLITGLALILLRAAGWSIVGTFVAMGPGVGFGSKAKLRNCVIGGALGGLIGGAAFQLLHDADLSGLVSRLIALGVIGFLIGLMVGVVESALKDSWLECVQGPLAGKQFILYERPMSIGSAPQCDIVLFKDPMAAPEHAVIAPEGGHWLITNLDHYYTGTFVNNAPTTRRAVTDGDTITTGSASFVFHERATRLSREEVRIGGS